MNANTLSRYLAQDGSAPDRTEPEAKKQMVEIFHENTKQSPATRTVADREIRNHLYNGVKIFENSRNYKHYFCMPAHQLPTPRKLTKSLGDLLSDRKSCREFRQSAIDDQMLSDLLSSLRVTREYKSELNPDATLCYRTYPSAGALYPVEIYVLRPTEDHLRWDCFHYAPREHTLTRINESVSRETVKASLQDHSDLTSTAGAIITLSAVFERTVDKYGPLGYRFALIEAGTIAQQLGLAATGLNLGSVVWGSVYDDQVNQYLHLDGLTETVLVNLFVGEKQEGELSHG